MESLEWNELDDTHLNTILRETLFVYQGQISGINSGSSAQQEQLLAQNDAENSDLIWDNEETSASELEGDVGNDPVFEEKTETALDIQQKTLINDNNTFVIGDLELFCELSYCDNQDNVESILRASGLHLGKRVSAANIETAIQRLKKTGYFSHVDAIIEGFGEQKAVILKTTPHTRVRKVRIHNHGSLYASEIKKHMMIRPGAALYPRDTLLKGKNPDAMTPKELMNMALEDQENSLKRLYAKEGYLDAQVHITTEEVEPFIVDLDVTDENVVGYQLGRLYLRGHKLFDYTSIETTFRSGVSFFSNFTKEKVEDAVSLVLDKYRRDGYLQTQIKFYTRQNEETHQLDVFLDIKEAKQWGVHFKGNTSIDSKILTQAVALTDSGYIDRGLLEDAAIKLRNHYIASGFYWAKTDYEMLVSKTDSPSIALFTVEEGRKAEIGEILFEGAKSLPPEQLQSVISTQVYSAIGSGGYPQRSMIADDASKIVDAYRELGFLNADVLSWTLEPIELQGRLRLTYFIHEGERTKLKTRTILYRDLPEYESKNLDLDAWEKDYFTDIRLREEQTSIVRTLRAQGYATASLRTQCNSFDKDGNLLFENSCDIAEIPIECRTDALDTLCQFEETDKGVVESCFRHKQTSESVESSKPCTVTNGVFGDYVEITHEVTLGSKYTVGDIFIHGNMITKDWVIHQDLPFNPGEVFDYNKVLDARSRLRTRTIYQTATVNVIGLDEETSDLQGELTDVTASTQHPVPIVVSVEESPQRWVNLALGVSLVSSDWIATFEAEYVNANLFGLGWDFKILLMPEAAFVNESRQFVFFEPFNQNWFTLISLQIPIIPAQGLNLVSQLFYDLRYIPDTSKEEQGINIELQWKATDAWFLALALEAKLAATTSLVIWEAENASNINNLDPCYPFTWFQTCPFNSLSAERSQTFSVSPKIVYEGRDAPLNPRNGFYGEVELMTAYSDVAGFYFRPQIRLSYLVSFLKHFTLAFNMRWGLTFMDKEKHLPLIDRFFLGGLNVRGFADEALGPRLVDSQHPNVATNSAAGGETLFNFSAELRFPIWQKLNIFGVVFLDAGSLLYDQPMHYSASNFGKELFLKEMRYTAGLGLRWMIAENIPPIVIDYGFILNRRRGDPVGALNLNIGYTF